MVHILMEGPQFYRDGGDNETDHVWRVGLGSLNEGENKHHRCSESDSEIFFCCVAHILERKINISICEVPGNRRGENTKCNMCALGEKM